MLQVYDFHYTKDQLEKIEQLRTLVKNDQNLQIGTENVFLSKFLYFTQWQVDKALTSIHKFYEFKMLQPDWLAHGPLSKFEDLFFFTQSKFVMPKPDREGRVILVFKVVDAFDRYPKYLQNIIQLDDLIFESLLLTEQAQKYGITIIYDLTNVSKNIMRVFSPSVARVLNEKNNVLPWTSRRIHYVQKGVVMNTVFSIFKSFLGKTLKEQIFSHDVNNLDQLRDLIGFESLPAIYGGPSENVLDINLLFKHIKQNEEYLMKIQNYQKKILTKETK